MINQRWYEFGTVCGLRYLFDKRGEGLEFHSHPVSQEHNVIILKGTLRVRGMGDDGVASVPITVDAPAIIDILPDVHELVALEDGTEILNIYKYGRPPEYDNLPESEKSASLECESLL